MVPQHDWFGKQFHKYVLHILPGSTQFLDFCRHRVLKRNPAAIAGSGVPLLNGTFLNLFSKFPQVQIGLQSKMQNNHQVQMVAVACGWPLGAQHLKRLGVAHAVGSHGIQLATCQQAGLGGPGR